MGAGDFMEDRTARVIHDANFSPSEDFDRDRSFPDLRFFVLSGHKEVASPGTGLHLPNVLLCGPEKLTITDKSIL